MRTVLFALGFGALGLVLLPVVVFFGGLALGYALDPRCGTAGDSGGCEMGMATLGFAAAPVGLLLGGVLGAVLARRGRRPVR